MSDVLVRRLVPEDTWTAYAIFRRSLADLLTRQGQSWPWVEHDETEWLQWRSLFEHLEATADEAWGAELDGQLVGYARSIRRADTRELTEFFTLPEAQGKGVGRMLLARAFPATGVRHRSILATLDPAALSQYLRDGMRASTVLYAFEGRPEPPAALPAAMQARRMHGVSTEDRLGKMARIDDQIFGVRRDDDHPWLGTRGPGWLLMRDDSPVGYAYGGSRQEPIATLDPRDMPAAIGVVEADALATSDQPLSLTVPLANTAATDYLLGQRYRLDAFTMHLLEDHPVVAADRYILTSPPFFL
ncbi:MAG: GNAT family N-acetyltransferase [Chloroflexi bacterium]|nr:GNAT family N-acetyltransferase [Chloroflexota bacterium]